MKTFPNKQSVTVFSLCIALCFLPHLGSAERGRNVEVVFERVDISPSTSVEVGANARYVIARRPIKGEAPSSEVVSTFRQDAPQKLTAAGSGGPSSKLERTIFAFSPPEATSEEIASVEVPVRYTIKMLMPDGSTKAMTRETTFVLPDRDRDAPLTACLRVQEFPGNNVRVGLAPCGQPWSAP